MSPPQPNKQRDVNSKTTYRFCKMCDASVLYSFVWFLFQTVHGTSETQTISCWISKKLFSKCRSVKVWSTSCPAGHVFGCDAVSAAINGSRRLTKKMMPHMPTKLGTKVFCSNQKSKPMKSWTFRSYPSLSNKPPQCPPWKHRSQKILNFTSLRGKKKQKFSKKISEDQLCIHSPAINFFLARDMFFSQWQSPRRRCALRIGQAWYFSLMNDGRLQWKHGFIYMFLDQSIISGQIVIFHQPRFPWNKGISLTKPPFDSKALALN